MMQTLLRDSEINLYNMEKDVMCTEGLQGFTEPSGLPWLVLSILVLSDWFSPKGYSLGNKAIGSVCPMLAGLLVLKKKGIMYKVEITPLQPQWMLS